MSRVLAPMLLVAAGLAGCLGYGDKDVVADTIRRTYTKRDRADCTDRQTRRFVEQATLIKGVGAVLMCRTLEDRSQPATSVVVSGVRVDGVAAHARVLLHGGAADGQRMTVRLVREPNGWKLDRLTTVRLNRRAFDRNYRQMLADSSIPIRAATRSCLERSVARMSTREIERAVVAGSLSAFTKASGSCFRARPTESGR